MRMLVVGAGSTGGYFGGRLAQAGRDVTFLVRAGRALQLQRDGLVIKSPHGDVSLAPRLTTATDIEAPYDVVLLAVKGYGLDAAMPDFAPAVGPATMVAPLLNGMRHMDLLDARFGKEAILGGVCKVATTLDEAGRIIQLSDFQELDYGERDGQISDRVEALHAFMKGAGFDAKLSTTITLEMWRKWILLAAMGGVTCLMRGSVGDIAAAAHGIRFVHDFVDEVVLIASTVGHPPGDAFIAATKAMLTKEGSPLTSSMFRDLQKGERVEADSIIGDLFARGQQAGLITPLLGAADTHLSLYQNRARK